MPYTKFKELIYDLMQGDTECNEFYGKESEIVDNEFKDGKKCEVALMEIYAAKERLLDKLHVEEDEDVESILDNYDILCKELCMKIYDYAIFFNKRGIE